jgi:DNA-binding transcriptional LysR family regulator
MRRFTMDGKSATVRPSGPLRVDSGDAMMPALIAGAGLGILPEFILRYAVAAGQLERLLPEGSLTTRHIQIDSLICHTRCRTL